MIGSVSQSLFLATVIMIMLGTSLWEMLSYVDDCAKWLARLIPTLTHYIGAVIANFTGEETEAWRLKFTQYSYKVEEAKLFWLKGLVLENFIVPVTYSVNLMVTTFWANLAKETWEFYLVDTEVRTEGGLWVFCSGRLSDTMLCRMTELERTAETENCSFILWVIKCYLASILDNLDSRLPLPCASYHGPLLQGFCSG